MTVELSRRAFGSGALALCGAPAAHGQDRCLGCRSLSAGLPSGATLAEEELDPAYVISSTGNRDMDQALGRALVRVRDYFAVFPGVGLYDDYPPNALAYSQSFIKGTKGTVVLGRELLKRQMSAHNDGGISVVAIAAHEFGHVIQNDLGIGDRLALPDGSKKLLELHADFMAGLYLANLATQPGIRLYASGVTFEGLGDTDFTNPEHHGTPAQRVQAIEFGFRVGKGHPELRPKQAFEESIRYVKGAFSV